MVTLIALLGIFGAISVPIDSGLSNDDAPALTYSGSWVAEEVTYAVGGDVHSTSSDAASVTFDLYSDGFTVFFLYDTNGADFQVCIDGECVTVSSVGAASRGRVSFTELATGIKSVEIKPVDPLTGDSFAFDAVYVHPTAPPEAEPEFSTVQTFMVDGYSYTGVLDFSLSGGDVAIVLLLVVLVLTQIARFIVDMWQ